MVVKELIALPIIRMITQSSHGFKVPITKILNNFKKLTFFADMLMLRNTRLQGMMTLFTGIIFLNMSFFLFEVKVLELDKNQKMVENIAKLIAGAASEEEKDIFGSSSEKDNMTTNALDLFLDPNHAPTFFLIPLCKSNGVHFDEKPIVQYTEIAYPPPKG